MLRIDRLTYRIGPRTLLDQAEATVNPGHRIGLVGRNGAGKTTLLRLIAGKLTADGGSVEVPSRWRGGLTRQGGAGGSQRLIDNGLGAHPEAGSPEAGAGVCGGPDRE